MLEQVPSWARDDCLTPSNDSPDWGSDGDRNVEVNHPDHDTDFGKLLSSQETKNLESSSC